MKTRLTAKHIMVLISLCGLAGASVGILLNTAGLFYTSVAEDLHVGRASVSMTMTLCALVASITGFLVPHILKKKNSLKPLIYTASFLMIAGTFMLSRSTSLTQLYIWNIVRGAGSGLSSFVLATIILNNWFYTHHGLFTSITLCFSGIPGALLSGLFTFFITNMGWQNAYAMVSIVILIFCLPALLFPIAFTPDEAGLKPYGYEEYQKVKETAPHTMVIEKKEQMHGGIKLFLLIGFTASCCIAASVLQHLPGFAESEGYSAALGSIMLSAANASNVIGKLLYGYFSDRIGTWKTSVIHASLAGAAMLAMLLIRQPSMLVVCSFIYGFTMANSATAMSLATSDIFGLQEYSRIYPAVNFAGSVTNAIGVTLLGIIIDVSGSYDLMMAAGILLEILTVVFIFTLYHLPHSDHVLQ
jgi:MFS family permease